MQQHIAIFCEAGEGKGLGHFFRGIALAKVLQKRFFITLFVNRKDISHYCSSTDLDWVKTIENFDDYNFTEQVNACILDGYTFSDDFITLLKKTGAPLIEISDFSQQLYNTPFWLNSSMESTDYAIGRGLQYSLLRPSILSIAAQRPFEPTTITSVFVAFGGTDELRKTLPTVKQLLASSNFNAITVIYPTHGIDYNELSTLEKTNKTLHIRHSLSEHELIECIDQSNICIVSSSTIACECIALRKIVFTTCLFENQHTLHQQLIAKKAAIELDIDAFIQHPSVFFQHIPYIQNPTIQASLFEHQQQLIDGNSAQRILEFIVHCIHDFD